MVLSLVLCVTVLSSGNRQPQSTGGHYERRVFRSLPGDPNALGGTIRATETIERVLQRLGITLPRVRLARWVSSHDYPRPQAHTSNELHQIDLVGPLYLKGKRPRYYILVCKDVFDGAVCLKLRRSRKMGHILTFLGDYWKTLGWPAQVQFDNARELIGWGPVARYLSRVVRPCLRFGDEPIFIPPRRLQYNGSVEILYIVGCGGYRRIKVTLKPWLKGNGQR